MPEPTRSDCPTCATPVLVISNDEGTSYYTPLDEDSAGAELSRMESDMLALHDKLVAIGLNGAINAASIGERIDQLAIGLRAARAWLVVDGRPISVRAERAVEIIDKALDRERSAS